MNKRIRVVLEFDINTELCEESGVSSDKIFRTLGVYSHDVIDGLEIYPNAGYDLSSEFYIEDPVMISKEFVN